MTGIMSKTLASKEELRRSILIMKLRNKGKPSAKALEVWTIEATVDNCVWI